MSKLKKVPGILLGVFLTGLALVLFLHDAGYLFMGHTVDLNEILINGEELPRDKYVTYQCSVPFGNYAETRSYVGGVIPLPGKTQQFAFLGENDMILSAEIGRKSKIQEMTELTDDYYHGEGYEPVTLVGCFEINSPDMDRYLVNYFSDIDLEEEGIYLTSYVINATKTRLKQALLYLFLLALGAVVLWESVKKFREEE